jgi:small subunit ribosomal protein S2
MSHLDPATWPKQAKMAADGKWDELNEWQEKAKAGVE